MAAADFLLRLAIIEKNADGGEKISLTKSLAFYPQNTIEQVESYLRVKAENNPIAKLGPTSEYGLFLPAEKGCKTGIWLENSNPIEFYTEKTNVKKVGFEEAADEDCSPLYLKSGDTVEYRRNRRMLKVRTVDKQLHTLLVHEFKTVYQLMDDICKKIGMANNREYSLAFADGEEAELLEGRDLKKLEMLKEKLRTEDEVCWLEDHKTLREQDAKESEPLLMRRKYFYSDVNVNKEDPVQLNMLFEQSKQAILAGTHPVTLEESKQFAAYLLQIQFGDHKHDKHKPGFTDIKNYLPEGFKNKARSSEKKILDAHQYLTGTSEMDAKYRYVKLARSLPTFGVHFFLVREAKRSKLVPLLLGITKDSILRLDCESKEVKDRFYLAKVQKWCSSPKIFAVDFGSHEEKPLTVQTTEGERIAQLIEGYVNIIMKDPNARINKCSKKDRKSIKERKKENSGKIPTPDSNAEKEEKDNKDTEVKPPPSERKVSVIQKRKISSNSCKKAKALCKYEANKPGQLSISENEILDHLEDLTIGWTKLRNADQKEGLVPTKYIEVEEEQSGKKSEDGNEDVYDDIVMYETTDMQEDTEDLYENDIYENASEQRNVKSWDQEDEYDELE